MLDRSGDPPATRAAERAPDPRYEAGGDPQALSGRVADRDHRRSDLQRSAVAPVEGLGVAGFNADHREVAIAVDAQHLAIGLAAIQEVDVHLVAVQVVGVGQDLALLEHDPRTAPPSVADAHRRPVHARRDLGDRRAELIKGPHRSCLHLCCGCE
ncbi:MAG: hypothetical protein E6I62_08030 [Chloroflexi bacterium]|nr:MAG: hypothetical protein E6I62_08030 [Chloroflexota bacterium]